MQTGVSSDEVHVLPSLCTHAVDGKMKIVDILWC